MGHVRMHAVGGKDNKDSTLALKYSLCFQDIVQYGWTVQEIQLFEDFFFLLFEKLCVYAADGINGTGLFSLINILHDVAP